MAVGQVTISAVELLGAIDRQREVVAALHESGADGWRIEVEELALEMLEKEVA